MKKLLFLFALFVFGISISLLWYQSNKPFVHPSNSCSDCHQILLPMYVYQIAEGTWQKNEDGTYWYLHSDEEFDTLDCQSCHPEATPAIYACPPEGQSCRIINDNGVLRVECEDAK